MVQALYFEKHSTGEVTCTLCPHRCKLKQEKKGICGVRKNRNGLLYTENYGKVSAIHFDPIEKKPLYHFYPGSQILSIGTIGCNLSCRFCQNYEISQADVESYGFVSSYEPEEILKIARGRPENIGISFTYNEPTIWYEYVMDVAGKAKENNMLTTMVTNGFINPDPFAALLPFMDAFNIDLKAFTDEFYRKYTSSRLTPVMDTILQIKEAGKHLEITNLIIPGLNDKTETFRDMVRWISTEVSEETVLHLSRYFPVYKMSIERTPLSTLERLYNIAREYLNHVFLGNVGGANFGKNTCCPSCGAEVIIREGYFTRVTGLAPGGTCSHCRYRILQNY
jgi:pyruvate formate lyase activating enzyme